MAELRRMVPAECKYDPERHCLEGTRKKVLQMIKDWIHDTNWSANLLWIHGWAGSGKSSIASSIAHRLDQPGRKCLGASFFCKRDDENLREPTLNLHPRPPSASLEHLVRATGRQGHGLLTSAAGT